MLRSMYAGVSGLKTHQTRMDVIGNNIANVNTAGFKSSRVTFKETLSQMMKAANGPASGVGGTNPHQIGLGVTLGSIDVKHTQGNTQSTGYITDLAIEGDGFFVLDAGGTHQYTRAGIFGLDSGTEGNLVSMVNGMYVLGHKADNAGIISEESPLEPLYISATDTIAPQATTEVLFAGNLDNRYIVGDTARRTVQVYDSRGKEQTVLVDLTKSAGNVWEWDASWLVTSTPIPVGFGFIDQGTYTVVAGTAPAQVVLQDSNNITVAESPDGQHWHTPSIATPLHNFEFERVLVAGEQFEASGSGGALILSREDSLTTAAAYASPARDIQFNADGSFNSVPISNIAFTPANANTLNIDLDFSEFTQYADVFTGKFFSQDGYANGILESYAFDQSGTIIGSFSNGLTRALGQVALARFANPAGLQRAGDTMFIATANSGTALEGMAGHPGYGVIAPSSLEMSNVDLGEEFTEMIVAQRGFQANSRIITTSDEMLQELVNMKR